MFVTPETFTRHLEWLARSFSVLPLHEIVGRLLANEPLPRGACAITFDDGWRDNFDFALPALVRQGLPATVFVVADRVGTLGAFWPDEICRQWAITESIERCARLREAKLDPSLKTIDGVITALKALDEDARRIALEILLRAGAVHEERELLDWDELERLAARGVSIESHSASHAILTGVSRPRLHEELTRSLRVLQERGHARHALLAYPSGAFNDEVVAIARDSGYRAAFTTAAGLATAGEDPLVLPRIAVHEDISGSRVEFLRRVPGAA
ncbi:polysaccharide deacetylase family protein [Myxococcota bacterium]|nr:polysaccharide deacetylase family protein [Myxococcota bacterium]